MGVLELPDAPGYGRGIHWVGATDPGAVGPLEVWFDPTAPGTFRVRNLANTAWLTVGGAPALPHGIIGVGIAWTAPGDTCLGNVANSQNMDQDAVDTVFLDIGGVASAPHGLTDGCLLAPAAGNYMVRAHVGGDDAGAANVGEVSCQWSPTVNGAPLGMAEVFVTVPSVAGSFNPAGALLQPLTLAAGDVVGLSVFYANGTPAAAIKTWAYSLELEQVS
jgi:hypothetical protein